MIFKDFMWWDFKKKPKKSAQTATKISSVYGRSVKSETGF